MQRSLEIASDCGLPCHGNFAAGFNRWSHKYIGLREDRDLNHSEAVNVLRQHGFTGDGQVIDALADCYQDSIENPEYWY